MADFIDHLHQALHNLDCAKRFVANSNDRDWAITAAFYSAVHFAEAGFISTDVIHSELKCPQGITPHKFREEKVKEKFGITCYRSYRKLINASYNVRYLPMAFSRTGMALDYYSQDDAKRFIDADIPIIINEIQLATNMKLE
ncbi:MAG: hypothetical protein ABSA01_06535 [Anaerolineales bacterium]|jgi:hypothetical protein